MAHIYLSGPITNGGTLPADAVARNLAAFDAAAAKLRAAGHTVHNPADVAREHPEWTRQQYMDAAFDVLANMANRLEAAYIAMLPGWENSEGARQEILAAMAYGICQIAALGASPSLSAQRLDNPASHARPAQKVLPRQPCHYESPGQRVGYRVAGRLRGPETEGEVTMDTTTTTPTGAPPPIAKLNEADAAVWRDIVWSFANQSSINVNGKARKRVMAAVDAILQGKEPPHAAT